MLLCVVVQPPLLSNLCPDASVDVSALFRELRFVTEHGKQIITKAHLRLRHYFGEARVMYYFIIRALKIRKQKYVFILLLSQDA